MLVHFDAPEAFGPFAHSTAPTQPTSSDGARTPRSSSRLSLSSISRPALPTFSSSATVSASSFADSPAASLAPTPSPNLPSPAPPPAPAARPSPFAPVLPDDFFAVLDAAKASAGHAAHPSRAAALLAAHPAGSGAGWGAPTPELGSGARGAWWGGPSADAEVLDEEEEEEDGATDASFESGASVVDHGEQDAPRRWNGGGSSSRGASEEPDADDSFEAPSTVSEGEGAADETPRMPSGFQP